MLSELQVYAALPTDLQIAWSASTWRPVSHHWRGFNRATCLGGYSCFSVTVASGAASRSNARRARGHALSSAPSTL
jgi:hypothetical protein